MKYSYNEYIGRETVPKEYKGFTLFKKCMDLTLEDCERYCESKLFDFNKDVLSNLDAYLTEYIPRYACGFWNSGISETEFYIGVNDYGLVRGIPFCNDTLTDKVTIDHIRSIIDSFVITPSEVTEFSYTIDMEWIDVEPPPVPDQVFHPEYKRYLDAKEVFMEKYNSFVKSYDTWKDKYSIVNYRLVDIFNLIPLREQLLKFIREVDPTNPVVGIVESDFQLQYMSGLDMKDHKLDKNSPYYWVTTFKDYLIDEYRKTKPVFHTDFLLSSVPFNLIISGDMIPYWMHSNRNMSLSVLRIVLRSTISEPNTNFFYLVPGVGKLQCKRAMVKGHPVCLPIYEFERFKVAM